MQETDRSGGDLFAVRSQSLVGVSDPSHDVSIEEGRNDHVHEENGHFGLTAGVIFFTRRNHIAVLVSMVCGIWHWPLTGEGFSGQFTGPCPGSQSSPEKYTAMFKIDAQLVGRTDK